MEEGDAGEDGADAQDDDSASAARQDQLEKNHSHGIYAIYTLGPCSFGNSIDFQSTVGSQFNQACTDFHHMCEGSLTYTSL